MIVVVMGVSGSGKTTIGEALAVRLGCEFLDGDDFHSTANVARMAAGMPLSDQDRAPWLDRLNALLRERAARGDNAVLACSALKESYRTRLMQGLESGVLVHLHGGFELIRRRLEERRHRYMPAVLLESQFAALEPPRDAIDIDCASPPARCVEAILARIAARPAANPGP